MKLKHALFALLCAFAVGLAIPAFAFAGSPPTIEYQPQNVAFPAGSPAAGYQCVSTEDPGHTYFDYHWYVVWDGKVYDTYDDEFTNMDWAKYCSSYGQVGNSFMFEEPQEGLTGAEIYCVVSNEYGSTKSRNAYVNILPSWYPTGPDIRVKANVLLKPDSVLKLYCDVRDYDHAYKLEYQWYETTTGELFDIKALDGENEAILVEDVPEGQTRYFVCGVFQTNSMGNVNYSYTSVSAVTRMSSTPETKDPETVESIEITSAPSKTAYDVGETVNLSGLQVRVYTNLGFYDTKDSSIFKVSPSTLNNPGTQKVTITYEGCSDSFNVTVKKTSLAAPVIDSQPKGGKFNEGTACDLKIGAHSPDGATLQYQWYSSATGLKSDMVPVAGATMDHVVVPPTVGSVFYCCSVKAVDGSLVSDTVYSDMVEVNYIKKATEAPGITVTPGTGNGTAVNGTTGNGNDTDILTPPEPALKSHNPAIIIVAIGLILLAIALAIIAAVLISRRRKQGGHEKQR